MEEDRKTTEAQRKAVYKYDEKFERVNCRFAVGTKERIRKAGYKSVNDFINKIEIRNVTNQGIRVCIVFEDEKELAITISDYTENIAF